MKITCRRDITPPYHGVTHDEDGQVRVAGFHQVDVLQGVSDENLEILDVHTFSFTLTVANWRSDRDRELLVLHNICNQQCSPAVVTV